MTDKISVIISNYNYGEYISEAIESVLAQTFHNYELIIVDDGSTDQSQEIIQRYGEQYPEQIKIILKENGGQASAFNAGFAIASGEIIAFLDADDYWYADKLETIAYYHQSYKGIQHNLLINNEKKYTLLEDKTAKQKRMLESYGFMGLIPTSGLSFDRKTLIKVFPIPEKEYRICADLYIRIMFLNYEDIFSLDTPTAFYRVHDSNKWYLQQSGFADYLKITINFLNERRLQENSEMIVRDDESSIIGRLALDYLSLNDKEKYIMYGTGELAKYLYSKLKEKLRIEYFTNSFVEEDDTVFLDKKVKSIEYLKNNKEEYDKIIVASTFVVDIQSFLLEQGFKEEQILVIRF